MRRCIVTLTQSLPHQGDWLKKPGPARDRLKILLPAPAPGARLEFDYQGSEFAVIQVRNQAREDAEKRLAETPHPVTEDKRLVQFAKDARKAIDCAQSLRDYIETVREAPLNKLPKFETEADKAAWIGWASQRADGIDPLTSGTAGTTPECRPFLTTTTPGVIGARRAILTMITFSSTVRLRF